LEAEAEGAKTAPAAESLKARSRQLGAQAHRIARVRFTDTMSGVGQNAKYPSRVDVFRFASKLGLCSTPSALRICANKRHQLEMKEAAN
jgi:hypothetical protein